MSGNAETLRAYEQRVDAYIDGTAHEIAPPTRAWIDRALADLPADARILEIGAAFGRDAAYIASRGYSIECTDAADSFVAELRKRGFAARKLNFLTDAVADSYDLIIANAVFLHFNRQEFALALAKAKAALKPGGRLAISLKGGGGEEWSDAKIGAPRYFCYWRPPALKTEFRRAGFVETTIVEAQTDRAHAQWLYVVGE
jgi:SAM-dependent methyltransferase